MRIIIPFSEDGMKCQTESLMISVHPDKSIAGYQGLRNSKTPFLQSSLTSVLTRYLIPDTILALKQFNIFT